jgi:hypothetical protein
MTPYELSDRCYPSISKPSQITPLLHIKHQVDFLYVPYIQLKFVFKFVTFNILWTQNVEPQKITINLLNI